jgi:hypothetical protein
MGLSSQAAVVTTKKAARLFFLGAWCTFFTLISAASHAQELSKPLELAGQKLIVVLEPREPSCQKAITIVVNKLFCFQVTVRGSNDAWLKGLRVSKFDALMPGHHHGMITRPKLTAKNSGQYLIEGVKLHMSGEWSLELKLEHMGALSQVAIPLKL